LIEKTSIEDISVNIVQMNERYETIVSVLSEKGVEEILNLGSDVFLNFDKLLQA